ncbi:hypothetical protein [Flavobacterium daemonense]|uniref:hypothetical protein n=1 Tax=Flavobacterium daemonense TaxID=1393049 RepID=UPI0011868EF9|nr:hypothetical protein [Flavobacterium daemonense]KAF2329456.1 hypothetical protein FND99_16770 [Flavobacterium daemonense]
MIIALHGGFSAEMLYGLGGGFVAAVLFLIVIHYRIYHSEYYNEEYVYFSSIKKIALYLGFITINLIVAYFLFFVFMLLIGGISSYFIRNF